MSKYRREIKSFIKYLLLPSGNPPIVPNSLFEINCFSAQLRDQLRNRNKKNVHTNPEFRIPEFDHIFKRLNTRGQYSFSWRFCCGLSSVYIFVCSTIIVSSRSFWVDNFGNSFAGECEASSVPIKALRDKDLKISELWIALSMQVLCAKKGCFIANVGDFWVEMNKWLF